MSNHRSIVIGVLIIISAVALTGMSSAGVSGLCGRPLIGNGANGAPAKDPCPPPVLQAPMASSGNNLYMAWASNDTGHDNVFFAKSTDGGRTLKIIMISSPNKGNTIDRNTEISASGSNVYVTWWSNKTGTLVPMFRASNDGGNTFGKTIMLNSTANP